jgi:hypothetical protein
VVPGAESDWSLLSSQVGNPIVKKNHLREQTGGMFHVEEITGDTNQIEERRLASQPVKPWTLKMEICG